MVESEPTNINELYCETVDVVLLRDTKLLEDLDTLGNSNQIPMNTGGVHRVVLLGVFIDHGSPKC